MRKRLFCAIAVALAFVVLLFFLYPHSLAVVIEGYPAAVKDDADRLVEIAGKDALVSDDTATTPECPGYSSLFGPSGGRYLAVYHQGRKLCELSSNGFGSKTEFNSYSMVKSLIGVMVLKAIANGDLSGLEARLGSILPSVSDSAVGEVTIRQLMDMKSGIVFEKTANPQKNADKRKYAEPLDYNPFGNLAKLHAHGPVGVLDEIEVVADKTFVYQNLNTALLGLMLENLYGKRLEVLLSEQILTPAEVQKVSWKLHALTDRVTAYCCLFASPETWAKIAHFLARNGRNGEFLTPELFNYFLGTDIPAKVRRAGEYRSQIRYDILDRSGETLQGPFYYFMGQGGQVVYSVPSADLVVIRFGEKHQLLHSTLYAAGNLIERAN